jgi:hypothetical protein
MEPTECSKTSAFNIQTPGKYPEENIPILFMMLSSNMSLLVIQVSWDVTLSHWLSASQYFVGP